MNRLLNYLLSWCLERIEPEKREMWRSQLEAPLPWQGQSSAPTDRQLEAEYEGFQNLMSMMGG